MSIEQPVFKCENEHVFAKAVQYLMYTDAGFSIDKKNFNIKLTYCTDPAIVENIEEIVNGSKYWI